MPRVAVITAAHRIIGAATRLLRPTDFDADTGRVDPVDIATAPGTTAGSLRLSANGPAPNRSDPRALRRAVGARQPQGTVDSPDAKPIYFEKVAQG
jgi:hypothetical protein